MNKGAWWAIDKGGHKSVRYNLVTKQQQPFVQMDGTCIRSISNEFLSKLGY